MSSPVVPSLGVKEVEARAKIGGHLVYWALGAVTLLGLVGISMVLFLSDPKATDADRFGYVKDIMSMLLPLIATWVGTVLAFYFSKENYQAAAESNEKLVRLTLEQKLQSISIEAAMIPIAGALNKYVLSGPVANVKLKADLLKATADASGKNRILILEPTGTVQHVAHRSIIDKFIADQAFSGKVVADLTLEDFLNDKTCASWISSFGALGRDKSLKEAKVQMDADPKCSDVVVTADGTRTSPALGWVTNVAVSEHSRL